jgi:septal ring factor EnvC (AmiA/AmiB activator)
MSVQIEDFSQRSEDTDELPVLSTGALRALRAADREAAAGAPDRLGESVEMLRAALQNAEQRWHGLEARLESQDRAIAQLQSALGKAIADENPGAAVPELTEVVLPLESQPAAVAWAMAADRPSPAADSLAPTDSVLLERIAALEAYINGRAGYWSAMEAELEAKELRIAELTHELRQRIAREEALEQQVSDAAGSSAGLRDELRRVQLALREIRGNGRAGGSDSPD